MDISLISQVSLRCSSCETYGSCGMKQEPPVQISSRHPTLLECLEELLNDFRNVMVNTLKILPIKLPLIPKEMKEKDTSEKAVEELKRQLQLKRVRTDDDAGDAHNVLAEFDNCDLSVHRRETTRVQNCGNV
jgi:hypothetical protein